MIHFLKTLNFIYEKNLDVESIIFYVQVKMWSVKFSLLKYILQSRIWKGENCDEIHRTCSFKQECLYCIEMGSIKCSTLSSLLSEL